MSWLRRQFRGSDKALGLQLSEDEIHLAVCQQASACVNTVDTLRVDDSQSERDLLKRYIHKNHLQGIPCTVVLSTKDYQLLLVEAPDVPHTEMREAIQWKVKDLLAQPLEASVIDVFFLPDDANRTGKRMLYVVVANRARVESIIDLAMHSSVKLKAIDIDVLAFRNILLLKNEERSSAVISLHAGAGEVAIYRDKNLYLSRHFQLDYRGGLLDELPEEQLALEVQRSFDYFERQMGQVPPGILYIYGEHIGTEKISPSLQQLIAVPIEAFSLSQKYFTEKNDDVRINLSAIGAVYNPEAA